MCFLRHAALCTGICIPDFSVHLSLEKRNNISCTVLYCTEHRYLGKGTLAITVIPKTYMVWKYKFHKDGTS